MSTMGGLATNARTRWSCPALRAAKYDRSSPPPAPAGRCRRRNGRRSRRAPRRSEPRSRVGTAAPGRHACNPVVRARRRRTRSSPAPPPGLRSGSRAPRHSSRSRPRTPGSGAGGGGWTRFSPRAGPEEIPGQPGAVEGHVDQLDRRLHQGSGLGEASPAPLAGAPGLLGGRVHVVLRRSVVSRRPQQMVAPADPMAGLKAPTGGRLHPTGQFVEPPGPTLRAPVGDLVGHRQTLADGGAAVLGHPDRLDQLVVELLVAEPFHPDGAADDV